MSKKIVLDEDEYVEALSSIIVRDFFPDLPKLQQHSKLLSEASSIARDCTSVRSNASDLSWDHFTPAMSLSYRTHLQSEDANDDGKALMTLNQFLATHTSEDNKSFKDLQECAVKDHQRRYHWAFEDVEEKGDPKLHLLTSGMWITKEQRKIADKICAPKGLKDDRPSFPETWMYRARNPLLFSPKLEASRDICQIKTDPRKHLELGNDSKPRSRLSTKFRKKTVYANSRFSSNNVQQLVGSGCEEEPTFKREEYPLVPMTPLIAPGIDASPLMTWGEVEGTPTLLGSVAAPERIWSTPIFEVQDTPRREKLANRLESEARHRNSNSRAPGNKTPLKRPFKAEETHLSRNIRARVSSARSNFRTPIGSDLQLRASYSTPLRLPRPPSKTRKTSRFTPKPFT